MDISRAVDEFVSSATHLFYQLQREGQDLSRLELHILAAQLQVLQTETARLRNQQSPPLRAPRSALAPILRVFDHHSLDLSRDKAVLLEAVIAFIRVGLEIQDTVLVLATKTFREAIASALQPEELENTTLLFFDAEQLLSRFLINGWPDESRFMAAMRIGLMLSVSGRVRIFQEMTSLLWTQATPDAVIHLEELFNKWISQKPIKLLCAYPLSHFAGKEGSQFQDTICELHR
ncbi:MAG TPA: MEDS domain-containing protein [Nitrospira sp.]|nr:MEDS domain-containing protein [Nitrospira sp.]